MDILINIETLTGQKIPLHLLFNCSIGKVKELIRDVTGWPPEIQRLIYQCK